MLSGIMRLAGRRETILPQLLEHFGDNEEGHAAAIAFLKRFAGTTFKVPSPREFERIIRDMEIAAVLSPSMDGQARLDLCIKHSVMPDHLAEIFKATQGRSFPSPPGTATSQARIDQAKAVYARQPGHMLRVVAAVFNLTPDETRAIHRNP